MQNQKMNFSIRYAIVAANALFLLWPLFNAMEDGFRGTLPEKISLIALGILLSLNSYFILKGQKK